MVDARRNPSGGKTMMIIHGDRPMGLVLADCVISAPGRVHPGLNRNDNDPHFSDAVASLKADLTVDMIGALRMGASLEEIRDVLVASRADFLGETFKHGVIYDAIDALEAQIEAGHLTPDGRVIDK